MYEYGMFVVTANLPQASENKPDKSCYASPKGTQEYAMM